MHIGLRLPVALHVLVHVRVLCRVVLLSEISVLAENLTRQSNLVSRARPVNELMRSKLALISLQEKPLIVVRPNPWHIIVVIIVRRLDLPLSDVLAISEVGLINSSYVFMSSALHEFSQIQLICFRHFGRLLKVTSIRCKVRVLRDNAFVLDSADLLIREDVLELGGLHLGLDDMAARNNGRMISLRVEGVSDLVAVQHVCFPSRVEGNSIN